MGTVQVILSEDVHALGDAGDIVSVKPGYARNFLIPQGKAMIATAERVNEVQHQKRVINEKLAKELSDLNAVKAKLHGMKLETVAQAGDEGKLFGSVTAANLAELIAEQGLEVDKRKIQLSEPIKTVGEHTVAVRLRSDVMADFKVTVLAASAPPPSAEVTDEGASGSLGAEPGAPAAEASADDGDDETKNED
ncbi:MAG: 50S ribosomal protein L9 [bacterium]|nr:50S ribosomal protein L9 [bacterium]